MNKQTIKDFLADPLVQDALKTDGKAEVARMAIMAGNLEKNQDLRIFGEKLMQSELDD
jgi:hypothetical protein